LVVVLAAADGGELPLVLFAAIELQSPGVDFSVLLSESSTRPTL
jgi:hypothetical protein